MLENRLHEAGRPLGEVAGVSEKDRAAPSLG